MHDPAPYIAAFERRQAAEQLRAAAKAEFAIDAARRIASHLAATYAVRRVVLFGSLARDEFRVESDIDLLVEGLPPDALFRAGADAEEIAGEIAVDLVPAEAAGVRLLQRIKLEGRVLYARD